MMEIVTKSADMVKPRILGEFLETKCYAETERSDRIHSVIEPAKNSRTRRGTLGYP